MRTSLISAVGFLSAVVAAKASLPIPEQRDVFRLSAPQDAVPTDPPADDLCTGCGATVEGAGGFIAGVRKAQIVDGFTVTGSLTKSPGNCGWGLVDDVWTCEPIGIQNCLFTWSYFASYSGPFVGKNLIPCQHSGPQNSISASDGWYADCDGVDTNRLIDFYSGTDCNSGGTHLGYIEFKGTCAICRDLR